MRRRMNGQRLLRLGREDHGSELVEFAMTGLLLVSLVVGVIELSLAIYGYHFASYAAQQGARFAAVRGSTWSKYVSTGCGTSAPPNFTMPYECTATSNDIQNYVESLATGGINPTSVTINTSSSYVWPQTTPDCTSNCSACANNNQNNPGCLVQVQVTYQFNFLGLRIFPQSAMNLTSTAEKVIQE